MVFIQIVHFKWYCTAMSDIEHHLLNCKDCTQMATIYHKVVGEYSEYFYLCHTLVPQMLIAKLFIKYSSILIFHQVIIDSTKYSIPAFPQAVFLNYAII